MITDTHLKTQCYNCDYIYYSNYYGRNMCRLLHNGFINNKYDVLTHCPINKHISETLQIANGNELLLLLLLQKKFHCINCKNLSDVGYDGYRYCMPVRERVIDVRIQQSFCPINKMIDEQIQSDRTY